MSSTTLPERGTARPWSATSREQEGLWLLEQTREIAGANNLAAALTIEGPLAVETVAAALRSALLRHPALRIELAHRGGRLVQRERTTQSCLPYPLERVRDAPGVRDRLLRSPLDPTVWPAVRAVLLEHGPQSHELLLIGHHTVVDGRSIDLLTAELAAACTGGASEPAPDPPADEVVAREQQLLAQPEPALAYWRPRISELADSSRIASWGPASGRSGIVETTLDGAATERLRGCADAHGSSFFVLLLTALQSVQHHYAGAADGDGVATAIAMDVRPRGAAAQIGMFANEAPLLSRFTLVEPFAAALARVDEQARALFGVRRHPFTDVVARLARSGEAELISGELAVTYLRRRPVRLAGGALELRDSGLLPTGGARRPLMLWLLDDGDELLLRLEHDDGAIPAPVAEGFVGTLRRLLLELPSRPQATVRELRRLAAEARADVDAWGRGPVAHREPDSGVHRLVEEQARRTPEAPAVRRDGEVLSYAQLIARAGDLAERLRARGVDGGRPVGLCAERSFDLVVGVLGILAAGGAYVPLDPELPDERLRTISREAGLDLVATEPPLQRRVAPLLPAGEPVAIARDGDSAAARMPCSDRPTPPDQLAYVLYTSGSTGTPKGVAMGHGALLNLLRWQLDAAARPGPRTTLQYASIGFDVAFQEIFSTLAGGGCLVLVDGELRRDPQRLAELVAAERIERLFLPFLALNTLAPALARVEERCGPLDVVTAGEQLEITPVIRALWGRRRDWTLENQYGPTESHVVTAQRLDGDPRDWPRLPSIGRPIDGVAIAVVDAAGDPQPVGVPGELAIGGVALARGYLNRPQLTNERFGPLADAEAGRFYRSGDVARWRPDGRLDCLGRNDDQIKVRGHRVEPGEIQAVLARHGGVREAAVVLDERRRLVAYVVPAAAAVDPAELQAFARERLPGYMVPAAYVTLKRLPASANGKLDRRALPAPGRDAVVPTAHVAPRDPVEAAIAEVWQQTLGAERVGARDDFFALGGDSLAAAEAIAALCERLGTEIPLRALFASSTVERLARAVREQEASGTTEERIPRAVRRPLATAE